MAEYKVNLAQNDVSDFVHAAEHCDCDIDIFYNRYIVDAKSLLGVFSLDLTKVLTVRKFEKNPGFEKVIRKYAVA